MRAPTARRPSRACSSSPCSRPRLPAGRHRRRPGRRSATRPTARSSRRDGEVVGSSLIGQAFTGAEYFHSAVGAGSAGRRRLRRRPRPTSELPRARTSGPTNEDLLAAVDERVDGLPRGERPGRRRRRCRSTPSPPRARASTRTSRWPTPGSRPPGWPTPAASTVDEVARPHRRPHRRPVARFLGEPGVNVLELNLALDEARQRRRDRVVERLDRQWPRADASAAGQLRIYLGAAPGVGKTFAMLNEGRAPRRAGHRRRRRLRRDPRPGPTRPSRSATSRSSPAERSSYRGTTFEEMDVDAVLARQPERRPRRRAGPHQRARLAATRSAGRTSRSCSTPASTSSRRSTSSTSSRSTTSSSGSPASPSARRSPTTWCGPPTRSSWST